jgi:hypothetical protein
MRKLDIDSELQRSLHELIRMAVEAQRPMLTYLLAMAMEELNSGVPTTAPVLAKAPPPVRNIN